MIDRNMSSIGTKIKELRVSSGLSQGKLGDSLGYHRTIVSRWETGYLEPTMEQVSKIAAFFHVPVSFFYNDEFARIKRKKIDENEELIGKMEDLFQ